MSRHMKATYAQAMQEIVKRYRKSGAPWPTTSREIARWAIKNKEWELGQESIVEKCAGDIASAMREEYYTDPQGRTVRTKHAARVKIDNGQMTLWADIRTASPQHMRTAFQQRRNQIFGDCKQLKTDVDSYNENADLKEPIQLVFDFTRDLLEHEAMRLAS